MSMCLALTKAGKSCRSNCEVVSMSELEVVYSCTCIHHRNYFTDNLDQWKEHLCNISCNTNVYYQIESLLKNKLIEIKPDDFLVQGHNSWFKLLVTMFAKYVDGFRIEWNPTLFKESVRQVGNLATNSIEYDDLLALAHCSSHSYILSILVEEYIRLLRRLPSHKARATENLDKWLLYIVEKEESFYFNMKECIVLHKILYDFNRIQAAKFLSYMNKFRKTVQKEKQEILSKFKEELLAVTWHPSRVLKWCITADEVKEWERLKGGSSSSNSA